MTEAEERGSSPAQSDRASAERAESNASSPAPCPARRPTPHAIGRRILVVEDEADLRGSIRRCLELEGYRVDEAADGIEALDVLRAKPPPSLILTDIAMPAMDGITFLERLKREPALAAIPVVVMTGSSWSVLASAPVARGYLMKPFDPGELLALLRTHAR